MNSCLTKTYILALSQTWQFPNSPSSTLPCRTDTLVVMADLSFSDGIKRSRSGTIKSDTFHKSSSSEDIRKRSGTLRSSRDVNRDTIEPKAATGEVSGSELIQAFEKQFLRSKDDTDATKLFTPEELNTLFSKETLKISKKKKKTTIGSLFGKTATGNEGAATSPTAEEVSAQNWDKV